MHDTAQLFDLFAKPFELFLGDAIVLRIARFDVGFFELLEARAVLPRVARPDIGKPCTTPIPTRIQTPSGSAIWITWTP